MRLLFLAALLGACATSAAPAALAAVDIERCTGVITSLPAVVANQGVWCLESDLSTAIGSGRAIEVQANNVVIDCNGHKVGGLAAGADNTTVGIYAFARAGVVVRNCNLRGFNVGVRIEGAAGNLVEDNRLEGSTSFGIWMVSAYNSTVRGNVINDTGGHGGGAFDGLTVGILVDARVEIIDNTVSGVMPATADGQPAGVAVGIIGGSNSRLLGNRVNGLSPAPGARSAAIEVGFGSVVQGNFAVGSGAPLSEAINCGHPTALVTGNVVTGFTDPLPGCPAGANFVNPN